MKTKNCIDLDGNIDRLRADRSCTSKTATTLKRKLMFLYFLTASKVKKIQPLSIKIALLTICWSSCSPTSNHHVDWYSLQNSMKIITLMYHNMNVLLDVSSSNFFFPRLLLFLSDPLWHHFTTTSKNIDPSQLKNGFHAGVDCFWPLPASPSPYCKIRVD